LSLQHQGQAIRTTASRGGSTYSSGCAAAHPDFKKNQRKKFFYIDILDKKKILNTLK
jgi:hypothetical protein